MSLVLLEIKDNVFVNFKITNVNLPTTNRILLFLNN